MPTINGTPGNDALRDTTGDDILNGDAGNDEIFVSGGRDVVDGGAGVDRIGISYGGLTSGVVNFGETGFDNATGDATTSVRFTSIEAVNITTGSGDDTIRTFFRPDANSDTIVSGSDYIALGAGNDRALGGGGNDQIFGGAGNDILDGDGAVRGKFGGARNLGDVNFTGSDTLFGEAGDDILQGGGGDDILDGGIGNDTLYGDGQLLRYTDTTVNGGGTVTQIDQSGGLESGNDRLNGGDGDDILVGGQGNDELTGGAGNDTARQNLIQDGADSVNLGEGDDRVEITSNADADNSGAIRLTFTSAEVGNGSAFDGGTLSGQDGGLGVRMQGENYADGLVGPTSRFDDEGITFVAQGTSRFDVRDLVSGAQRGNLFSTVTLGTMAADTYAGTDAADYINGGMGADTLSGGLEDDFLVGGAGDDVLTGGAGNDSLLGGAGADTANFNVTTDGADTIDLGADQDRVLLAGAAGQIRLTFTSGEVGNGTANDSNTLANQDGGLGVRLQAEDGADALTGSVSRFDDEGVTFVAGEGQTFDVRDLPTGTQRGNQFTTVTLGTSGSDMAFGVSGATAFNGTAGADYINAGGGDDSVNGGDGDDFLVGGAGDDTLNGGAGRDTILGGAGNDAIDTVDRPSNIFGAAVAPESDTVDAGAGDDTVTAGRTDVVNGGDGMDFLSINFGFDGQNLNPAGVTLTLDSTGAGVATDGTSISNFERVNFTLTNNADLVNTGNVTAALDGQGGNDTLTTGNGDDQVSGGAGDDIINSGAGADTLSGGSGNDVVNGGDGDDTFSLDLSQDGADQVNLGAGNDTVRFDGFATGQYRVTFTSAEVGNGSANDGGALANQDGGLGVRIQRENADGTLTGDIGRFDDEGIQFIAGTQGITFDVRDLVSGAERGDQFEGVVLGTSGSDTLSFFPPFRAGQAFYYNAGAGNDTVIGGDSNDFLVGGAGDDVLNGGAGNDTFIGGGGNDVYDGGAGIDTVTYASSTAGITIRGDGNSGSDGLGGTDILSGIENIVGSAFNDTIIGNGADNRLDGGLGRDVLLGLNGDDVISGGTGAANELYGGAGNDLYLSEAVGDTIVELTGGGIDTVQTTLSRYALQANVENLTYSGTGSFVGVGNAGANVITGGTAYDVLLGGDGNDTLIGGSGAANELYGGAGDDTYIVTSGADTIVELDGGGVDTVRASSSFTLRGNVENLTYTGTGDFAGTGNALANVITGGVGSDTLTGGLGNDTLIGGEGFDTVVLAGNRADYTFTRSGDGFRSVDSTTGRDGTDDLRGVEQIRFADGSLVRLTDLVPTVSTALAADDFLLTDGGPQTLPIQDDAFVNDGFGMSGFDPAGDSMIILPASDDFSPVAPFDPLHTGAGHDPWG